MIKQVEIRDIPGINAKISSGPVFIFKKNGDKLQLAKINPPIRTMKYPTVTIDAVNYRVHKLVALAFSDIVQGEPGEGKEIDHINGNKEDNRPENLRWVSHYENMNNPVTKNKSGRHSQKKPFSVQSKKTLGKYVYQYTKDGKLVGIYKNAYVAEDYTGVAENAINMVANGTPGRHSAGGFVWRYF